MRDRKIITLIKLGKGLMSSKKIQVQKKEKKYKFIHLEDVSSKIDF